MSTLRISARIAVALCIAGIAVTGCGRKGSLDRPSTPVEEQNIRKTPGQNNQPVTDRPFFLDPLL